mgnify:CR=1 FL=1
MGFWDQMPPGHNNGGPSHVQKYNYPLKLIELQLLKQVSLAGLSLYIWRHNFDVFIGSKLAESWSEFKFENALIMCKIV